MNLSTPISELNRVGKTTSKRWKSLGIRNVRDLLFYFPFRYEDYRRVVEISQLRDGDMVTVCGQVELIANKRSFKTRKVITEALISDKSGSLRVVWFNQPFIVKNIKTGDMVYLSGKVKSDMLGAQLIGPAYEKYPGTRAAGAAQYGAGKKEDTVHTARLVPIYPLTYGLTQKQIRFLINQVIVLADKMVEWVPKDILEKFDLAPLGGALRGIHFPQDENELKISTDRLKFDEIFLTQMKAELSKKERGSLQAPSIIFKEEEIKNFVASLPFILTKTQKIAAWEILQDISKSTPMNRLVSGDVGSGKTVVAAIALYSVFLNGGQGVIMAPTEILAQQHFYSLTKLFNNAKLKLALLTGSLKKKEKDIIIGSIKNGEIDIAVGTHALLTEGVKFKNLNLVVVDEQHRFGVEQRKLIKEKSSAKHLGKSAHFLSMTATPIPRSLALMIYGDLDVSIINELPPGRKKIITRLVEPFNREKAYQFIREQVQKGRQIFVICPAIEDASDDVAGSTLPVVGSAEKKSVMSEYEKLSKITFPDLRVGYLHGKLKPDEKKETMSKFKEGRIDLLVSTSVVEVGVDIPNASIMMIEGAENFGLAQLHQFRGRVGRSTHQSYCLLFTGTFSHKSLERLKFFEQNSDGFKLAEKDLEMRGPGEVYGTEQSGDMNLRLAKLTDQELVKKCREAAKTVVNDLKKYSAVLTKVRDWENQTHFE
ncbi:MAG: ATP-dependent DNA helicase RecG [Candidatus Magasanikbacteria bacterium RIFOXYD2_FULL_39_9]|uniref:ATP-dependent DNA helicase RecG n=1 Tax=Candidatus Magasanikbacteria bacterium RIFOXYD1_FULL_40_23 TaxID=1798705 RepID=A0A1F6P9X2_9BACT|nr:MAG: ATP-dependent DNA helicase RecG [Candidatus Magasanikbacteria bacterium RIFOXYD1_FULL_40_23]OGH93027.1 MAG: ATP-dependent DNA helicase RecG [Candidatus Magasanikbacteria bacterium RIFOXYD2_FULL_39_9]